ncbi:MAG TPA: hypothetical protein VK933_14400 [Longimicrobiales bacterium]|nr:hypothetical protein [Longimicrobiales bacterium]
MNGMMLLLQTAATPSAEGDWVDSILTFLDTPAPYSPLSEYLLVLFVLWLIARRSNRKSKDTFESQAQEVLDDKLQLGELSRDAYDRFRQDLILRPRR